MKDPKALLSALILSTLFLTGCASTGTTPAQSQEAAAPAEKASEPAPAAIPQAEPECD